MKKLLIILGLFATTSFFAQGVAVSGHVIDGANAGRALAFANVKVKGLDIYAEADINGSFQLNLLEGTYSLIIDFVGYEPIELEGIMVKNKNLTLEPTVLGVKKLNTDILLAAKG
jgi:hypothetical protein